MQTNKKARKIASRLEPQKKLQGKCVSTSKAKQKNNRRQRQQNLPTETYKQGTT